MLVYIFNLNPNPNHIWCLSGVLVWCFLSGVCLVFSSFLFVWCFVYGKKTDKFVKAYLYKFV